MFSAEYTKKPRMRFISLLLICGLLFPYPLLADDKPFEDYTDESKIEPLCISFEEADDALKRMRGFIDEFENPIEIEKEEIETAKGIFSGRLFNVVDREGEEYVFATMSLHAGEFTINAMAVKRSNTGKDVITGIKVSYKDKEKPVISMISDPGIGLFVAFVDSEFVTEANKDAVGGLIDALMSMYGDGEGQGGGETLMSMFTEDVLDLLIPFFGSLFPEKGLEAEKEKLEAGGLEFSYGSPAALAGKKADGLESALYAMKERSENELRLGLLDLLSQLRRYYLLKEISALQGLIPVDGKIMTLQELKMLFDGLELQVETLTQESEEKATVTKFINDAAMLWQEATEKLKKELLDVLRLFVAGYEEMRVGAEVGPWEGGTKAAIVLYR